MRILKIDPEFRDKVPPLTETELKTLEENIIKDGRVLVPLVVWNGTIIDGHNRYSIVQKHPEIPFDVVERDFEDRYEAIVWICRNQLGRRNLTDEQKTYLIGKQYEAQKKTTGAQLGNDNAKKQSAQNGPFEKQKTAAVVAKEHGVGCNTVKRAEKFSKGVDTAEKIAPGAKEAILSGKSKVPKSVVSEIPAMEPEKQKEVVTVAKSGLPWQKQKSGNPAGYPKEQRELNSTIESVVSSMYDTERTVEHTVDDLLEDLNAIFDDFSRKLKRSIQNNSTVLQDDCAKEKVIAALSEAEAAIRKIRGLII